MRCGVLFLLTRVLSVFFFYKFPSRKKKYNPRGLTRRGLRFLCVCVFLTFAFQYSEIENYSYKALKTFFLFCESTTRTPEIVVYFLIVMILLLCSYSRDRADVFRLVGGGGKSIFVRTPKSATRRVAPVL